MVKRAISDLQDGGYIMVNKPMREELGINAALMYGELCSEHDYWYDRNQMDDEGWFFSTVENIEKATGLSKYNQQQALKQLENYIEVKYDGMPRKRFIRLVGKNLAHKQTNDSPTSSQNISPLEGKNLALNNNNNNIINNIYDNLDYNNYEYNSYIINKEIEKECNDIF